MQEDGKKRDVEKERYSRKVIGEAARSGVPVRQFCPALGGEAEEDSVLLVAEEAEEATGGARSARGAGAGSPRPPVQRRLRW